MYDQILPEIMLQSSTVFFFMGFKGTCLCSRVRLGLQRQGTYLVVELERRPSTPAGALTAFMGAMGNGG